MKTLCIIFFIGLILGKFGNFQVINTRLYVSHFIEIILILINN